MVTRLPDSIPRTTYIMLLSQQEPGTFKRTEIKSAADIHAVPAINKVTQRMSKTQHPQRLFFYCLTGRYRHSCVYELAEPLAR
jgi:hypothetical protein